MTRPLCGLLCLAFLAGCGSDDPPAPRPSVDAQLFGPVSMRLHPFFTQIRDWTGDGRPDGIEAVVELSDQFGEPVKATGRVLFELYDYASYKPDPRGRRLLSPWEGRLLSVDDQRTRWSVTSRAYVFRLAWDDIRPGKQYVLSAQFDLSAGGRFFNQLVIEGAVPEPRETQTPSTNPATAATTREMTTQPANAPPARTNEP